MKKSIASFLFAVGVLMIATALSADDRTASCSCGTPSQVPTAFVIHPTTTSYQQAATEAFNNWNQYLNGIFRPTLDPTGEIQESQVGDGINDFAFVDFSVVPGATPGLAGYTISQPGGAFGSFNQCPIPAGQNCGTFTEADVVISDSFLNPDNPLGRTWSTDRPDNTENDPAIFFQGTATHELGHSMGFHHNFRNISMMNYYQDFAGQYISRADVLEARAHFPGRVISLTDLGTYAFRYDPIGQPVTPSDDPNVPASRGEDAVLLTTVSPRVVPPGGAVQIKNWTLENLSTSSVSNARIRFYLSTDRNITTSDVYLGGVVFSNFTTWTDSANGGCGSFNNDCTYTVPANTPPGTYYVGAIALYGDSLTQDAVTYNNSWSLPDPISVGSSSGGGGNALSLLNGRFTVTLTGKDTGRSNAQGVGVPIQEVGNDKFGYFYFNIPGANLNDPNNPEVFIKVLGPLPGDHYWIFYSGLTDLEYSLTVNDRQTGKSQTYRKAAGSLCGRADIGTFGVPGDSKNTGAQMGVFTVDISDGASSTATSSLSASALPIHAKASCDVDVLCLLNSRFVLALAASTPDGSKSGTGLPIKKSDGFGYFSIPALTQDAKNPEVFVKMLNAGGSTYFIFLGALTDFELLLRVGDTVTGKIYDISRPKQTVSGGVLQLCGGVAAPTF